MEKREILKETELFVLDMDGTFLSGYGCARRGVGFPGGSEESREEICVFYE